MLNYIFIHTILLLSLGALASCGGGGSSSLTAPESDPGTNTTLQDKPKSEILPKPQPTLVTSAILQFDSADTSVVLRSSLTSPQAISSAGGSEEPDSVNTFHSELGMIPSATDGKTPGCRFDIAVNPILANLPEGQISIEVEREWLGIEDPVIHSSGANHSSNEYLLSYSPDEGKLRSGRIYLQTNQALTWFFSGGEKVGRAKTVNSSISARFARITLSWTKNQSDLYIDGLHVKTLPRNEFDNDLFSTIYIGNYVGTGGQAFNSDFYIRNLLVATKPVILKNTPHTNHIMQMGDSFANGQPYSNVAPKYDGTIANTIIRNLALSGIDPIKYTVYSNGGGQIQDASVDPLELDVNGSGKPRSIALTEDPSTIIFITGGNDLRNFNKELFTIDLHDHIQAFLGEGGYPVTTTINVIVTTTVSHSQPSDPRVLDMVQIINNLEDWWDSMYPDRAGAVEVVDMWAILGGSDISDSLFPLNDPIHPAPIGNIFYGKNIYERIKGLSVNTAP